MTLKSKTIKCPNCKKEQTKVYVISEACQEFDLETEDYGMPEMLITLRTECECGQILAEGDI